MDQYYNNERSHQLAPYDSGWRLIKSYWNNKKYLPIFISAGIIVGVTSGLVVLDFIFNYWYYSYFYTCLQTYDKHGLTHLLSFFVVLTTCYTALGIHRYLASQLVDRQWLNQQTIIYLFLKYRRLLFHGKKIKNYRLSPYQPIIELVNASLEFAMRLVIFITTFSAFMYYLCLLIDELTTQFHLVDMTNYCLGVGIGFAIFSTLYLIKNKSHFLAIHRYLITIEQSLPLWLLAGHSVIYVIFSLLLILPGYIEKIYLLLAVIYSLQIFLRGQRLFLFGREESIEV